jgi:hypothetical protein
MTYISVAAHNNELIVINNMETFTAHFCYSKKQRQGLVETVVPVAVDVEEVEKTPIVFEIEETPLHDEDEL